MVLKITLCYRCHAELTVETRPSSTITNDVLSSMYTPSDSELSHIRPLIKSAESDLDRYNAEISRLSETLATLTRQRDELLEYRDRYRAVVSSVRKLPVEVIIEIFSLCCSTSLLVDDDGVEAPALALSQTCSFWREIALDSPKLWPSLSLNLGYVRHKPGLEYLVDLHLARSDSAPLILDVKALYAKGDIIDGEDAHGRYIDSEDLGGSAWSVLQSLFNEGSRWLTASLDLGWDILCRAESYLYDVWELPSRRQSILRSLKIDWQTDFFGAVSTCFFSILGCAPDLQYFQVRALNEACLDPSLTQWVLNIKILDQVLSLSDVFWLLDNCTHLQGVQFHTTHVEDTSQFPLSSPKTFPELRSLTYDFYARSHGSKVISSLTLPSLTTLDLTTYGPGSATTDLRTICQNLKDMIQRSDCQLLVLRLAGPLFASDQELIEMLSLTPFLIDLELDVTSKYHEILTSHFFRRLSFPSAVASTTSIANDQSATVVLPRLRDFRLVFQEDSDLVLRAFVLQNNVDEVLPPLPNPEDIFALVHSRTSLPSSTSTSYDNVELQKLERFQLSVDLYTEAGREWNNTSFSSVESCFRGLEREGLELSLCIYGRELYGGV